MKFLVSSVASQLTQSVLSLTATLIFAHSLTITEFGTLSAFWIAWMLMMSLLRAVFGEQVVVRGADHEDSIGFADFAVILVACGLLLSALLMWILRSFEITLGLMFVAGFVLSDALRYVELARNSNHGRSSTLLAGEFVRLSLASCALVTLYGFDRKDISLGLISLAAIIWVLIGIRRNYGISMTRAYRFICRSGDFERAITVQYLAGAGVAQAVPYLALLGFGPSALGAIRLAQSLLSPITLLTTALQPKLLMFFGQFHKTAILSRHLRRAIFLFSLASAIMAVLSWLIFPVVAHPLIPDAYRSDTGAVLIPLLVLLAFTVIGQPGGAVIRVLRLGRLSLTGQLVGVAVTIILALVALHFSLVQFAWALSLGGVTTVIGSYILLSSYLRKSDRS